MPRKFRLSIPAKNQYRKKRGRTVSVEHVSTVQVHSECECTSLLDLSQCLALYFWQLLQHLDLCQCLAFNLWPIKQLLQHLKNAQRAWPYLCQSMFCGTARLKHWTFSRVELDPCPFFHKVSHLIYLECEDSDILRLGWLDTSDREQPIQQLILTKVETLDDVPQVYHISS